MDGKRFKKFQIIDAKRFPNMVGDVSGNGNLYGNGNVYGNCYGNGDGITMLIILIIMIIIEIIVIKIIIVVLRSGEKVSDC